jgi:hypothetical protein
VTPGPHSIRASKFGYEPTELHPNLNEGKLAKFNLQIYADDQLVERRSPFPFWIPLAITGGGAALAGLGAVFLSQSNSKLKQFDQAISNRSDCNVNGCVPDAALADLRSSGKHYKTAAMISLASGATLFVGGVVLTLIDIPVSERVTPEEKAQKPMFEASIGPGYAGIVGTGNF